MPIVLVVIVLFLIGAVVAAAHRWGAAYIHPWWLHLGTIVAVVGTIWWLLVLTGLWSKLWSITLP